VRVHSYSTIEDSVILPDVDIGQNCRIKHAIIGEGCRIPPNTVIGENRESDREHFYLSGEGVVLVTNDMLDSVFPHVA
jgi:glucose-1-phosphate adenylyltransferase